MNGDVGKARSDGPPPPAEGVRIEWSVLPSSVRAAVERALGTAVVSATTQRGGFSPGVASRLALADGRRAFVKAVHPSANRGTPLIHLREARVLRELPSSVPAPRLLDQLHVDGYVVLCIEDINGVQPRLPWRDAEVRRVVLAVEELAATLTPTPISAPTLTALLGMDFHGFRDLATEDPAGAADVDPWLLQHLPRLAHLEATREEHSIGDSLLHCDLRADNILLTADRVVFVDWPHVALGPPWFDLMGLLPSVSMQGGPPPWEVFDISSLGEAADGAAVDALLCALTGYFVAGCRRPPPPGIPTLREFQRAQGVEALAWLRHRIE